jgi:large subunit ribosomal protein L9
MEVILREDVAGLGIIGDVVKVKPGYARNFLLPRGLAVVADRRNLGQLEHHKRIIAAKKARERGDIEGRANRIAGLVLETEVRAGKGGRLFGSVTNLDVKKLLDDKGFDVDRRRIELKDPIKEIGEFDVLVRVGQDVTVNVKVIVKPLGGQLEDKSVEGEGAAAAPAAAAEATVAPSEDAPEA